MREVGSGNLVIVRESKIELSAGRAISCLIKANRLENGEGEFLGIVECFMDVTQLNSAREEREKLEAQLQQAQRMESIDILAGGIAHDFNNILFSVLGYTELALDDTKRGTWSHDNLQEVLLAAHRATDLVKQILAFSRQANRELKPLKVR
jgi:signal transduction histidine kinase